MALGGHSDCLRCPFPDPSHMQVVSCHSSPQPALDEVPILLAAAAYLHIPVVFDEFIEHWTHLAPALEGQGCTQVA